MQSLTSSYTLRYKMLSLVDAIYSLGQLLIKDVTAVQELVQFDKVLLQCGYVVTMQQLSCCAVTVWLCDYHATGLTLCLQLLIMHADVLVRISS